MIEISGIDVKTGSSLDYASSAVVCGDYDVIVVGGGIAGVAAAVSAARNGARTAVIEPRNFVGGNAAIGLQLLGGHTITGLRSAAGLAEEFLRRLKFFGGATDMVPDSRVCSVAPVEPGWAKIVSFQMLDNAGVDLHFHSAVSHLLMDGNRVRGIVVNGRRAYTAKIVVDTSGDAVIAAMAGAPFEIGTGNDGWAQPSTLMVRVGAVDTERAHREIVERDLQVIHREFLEAHNIDYRRMAPWIGPHYNCNAFVEEGNPSEK